MVNLVAVNHRDSRVSLEEAIALYRSRWDQIVRTELGVENSKLDDILRAQIQSRLETFPEGQKAVIDEDKLKLDGTIYSILFVASQLPYVKSWHDLTGDGYGTTHNTDGDSLICYAAQSNPNIRGTFRMMLHEQKKLADSLGVRLFVFTRPNGFRSFVEQNEMPPNEPESIEGYLRFMTSGDNSVRGDVVRLHHYIGARLALLLRDGKPYLVNGRPADLDSLGYNVLMEYPTIRNPNP